jgi:hypothetical protein
MKHDLTLACAVVFLLALGALAVLARPEGVGSPAVPEPVATAAPSEKAAPAAPSAAETYNVIPVPLPAVDQFPAGQFNAAGLASVVGPGVQQVLEWNPATGSYLSYIPGIGGDEIPLKVGGVYWFALDSSANPTVSFMGDVPAVGSVKFTLVRPTTGGCVYNDISLPLDRDFIATAQALADSIGNVAHVREWDPSTQTWRQYRPGSSDQNFAVKIGYPYHVCLMPTGRTTWP